MLRSFVSLLWLWHQLGRICASHLDTGMSLPLWLDKNLFGYLDRGSVTGQCMHCFLVQVTMFLTVTLS